MAEVKQDLVEKARVEYGITNADQMSETQLKSEIKAIDDQAAAAEKEEAKAAKAAKANSDGVGQSDEAPAENATEDSSDSSDDSSEDAEKADESADESSSEGEKEEDTTQGVATTTNTEEAPQSNNRRGIRIPGRRR